jgi:molybdopterin converting factor small subunit
MRVTVRYLAQLKQAAGTAAEEVHLDAPCSAADLVLRLAQGRGERLQRLLVDARGGLHPTVLVFVGEEQVPPGAEHRLRDGDVLTLLLPIAGGEAVAPGETRGDPPATGPTTARRVNHPAARRVAPGCAPPAFAGCAPPGGKP